MVVAGVGLTAASGAWAFVPGGGPKKTDCLVVLMANGVGFPGGGPLRGTTCADGDVCDADFLNPAANLGTSGGDGGCSMMPSASASVGFLWALLALAPMALGRRRG